MRHFITINAQNYHGRGVEYTNILYDSLRRNLPDTYEGDFTVFSDTTEGYTDGILVRPLPCPSLTGWWNKLSLFQPDLFPNGDRLLYFDLSCIVTGRIDLLADYIGPFAILQDFFYPNGLQSSVMLWEAGTCLDNWTTYQDAGYPQDILGGDQVWIEQQYLGPAIRLQDTFPHFFASYKQLIGIPAVASVVVCHGHPKPHECDGWVPSVWKIGGLTRAELDAVCNTMNEQLLSNIRASMQRPHAWFNVDDASHDRPVCIVGGSPSLAKAIDALRWQQQHGHEIWATNGAYDYLTQRGIMPSRHVILDARVDNAAFVQHPSHATRYLIASHCDPSIFDALSGYDVTIFHCHIEGAYDLLRNESIRPVHLLGGYTTVGMKAAHLAELLGASTILLYGMDSCYLDGQHHAFPQVLNEGETRINAVYGERVFSCAPWMVGQAQDFIKFVQDFHGVVAVDGPGFLAHIARTGIPETPSGQRAKAILRHLPDGPVRVAEIGIFCADLSRILLRRNELTLVMVDSWKGDGASYQGDSGDWHASLTQEAQDRYYQYAQARVRFAQSRAMILRMESAQAAMQVADASLDAVFIDADHSYEGCIRDITLWAPKVKPGGWLSGHDYENTAFEKFGVTRAVKEYARQNELEIELDDNFTWFIYLPEDTYDRHYQQRHGTEVDCAPRAV